MVQPEQSKHPAPSRPLGYALLDVITRLETATFSAIGVTLWSEGRYEPGYAIYDALRHLEKVGMVSLHHSDDAHEGFYLVVPDVA